MKAVVKYNNGPKKLALMDVGVPKPAAGQVRIRVAYCGICGTDIHIYNDDGGYPTRPPVTLGHELSGIVDAVGDGVDAGLVGKRVVSETYYHTCGHCIYCQTGHKNLCPERASIGSGVNGAMAEYVVVPAGNLHLIPEGVSLKEAAMAEPMACCAQGVLEFGGITPGDKILITGPGAIGLMCLQVAVSAGGEVIMAGTAADEERLALALRLGAKDIICSDRPDVDQVIAEKFPPYGPDIVFDCSGAGPAIQLGLRAVRKGGRYVQVGLTGRPTTLDMNLITLKELSVYGTFAQKTEWWIRSLDLLRRKEIQLEPLVSHVYPIDEWQTAFEGILNKIGLKYLLKMSDLSD